MPPPPTARYASLSLIAVATADADGRLPFDGDAALDARGGPCARASVTTVNLATSAALPPPSPQKPTHSVAAAGTSGRFAEFGSQFDLGDAADATSASVTHSHRDRRAETGNGSPKL